MLEVVLLHGLGADRRAFQRFMRLLPDDWHVTALDLLGHGNAPKPEHGYGLEQHADFIAEQLPASSPSSPAGPVVIGHSYGASTATATAARHPELVRAIVLLDPVVAMSEHREASGTMRMMRARREGTLPETVAAMYPDSSGALRRWTIETWSRMSVGVIDEFDLDWTRFAEHVACPVGIVHGELGLGGGGDLAADWFDDPVIRQIDGAGHYLHATHARETAQALTDVVAGFGSQEPGQTQPYGD